jgi:hypothetical protein
VDIFTLAPDLSTGTPVEGYDSAAWTERYLTPGEFKLSAENDLRMLDVLRVGAFISHQDTREVMIVEDIDIEKKRKEKPTISVTGRSFDSYLENRVTVPNSDGLYISGDTPNEYVLPSNSSWDQAVELITNHLISDIFPLYQGHLNFLTCYSAIEEHELEQTARVIERGYLHERVFELLGIGDCGIKTQRPIHPYTELELVIHRGVDRSDLIQFVALLDELEEVRYFQSIKDFKTTAFVEAKYHALQNTIPDDLSAPPLTPYDLRWEYVDAGSIENEALSTEVSDALMAKSKEALGKKKKLEITHAVVNPDIAAKYNKEYSVGDIVNVVGEFGTIQDMRITEFTRTEDKDGTKSYPTLAPVVTV